MRTRLVCIATGLFLALGVMPVWGAAGGFETRPLPSKGHYVLVLPKAHAPGKTYELILALHGSGDSAENFARCWQDWMGPRDAILAVPEGQSRTSWSDPDYSTVFEAVEDAVKNYGADPKRVLLTGHSAGCSFGFYVLAKRPELFVCYGGTAHACNASLKKDMQKAAERVAIYYAVGTKDFNHPAYKPTVDLLTELKFNLKTEEPDIGHTIVPEEIKHMLAHFEASQDRVGQARLAEGQKLLSAKSWGPAETALAAAATGQGPSAADARKTLEALRKEWNGRLAAASALPGPEALEALAKLQRELPGTSAATQAKTTAEQVAADPKTKALIEQKRRAAREAEARARFESAQAQEQGQRWIAAEQEYERVAAGYSDTPFKAQAQTALERLKKDPRLAAARTQAEADKLFRQVENLLRNNMKSEARETLLAIAEKFPGTDAAKRAQEQAQTLR